MLIEPEISLQVSPLEYYLRNVLGINEIIIPSSEPLPEIKKIVIPSGVSHPKIKKDNILAQSTVVTCGTHTQEEKDLLKKMMGALDLSYTHWHLETRTSSSLKAFHEKLNKGATQIGLIFGPVAFDLFTESSSIGGNYNNSLNRIQKMSGCQWLVTYDLNELVGGKSAPSILQDKKRKIWQAMKQLKMAKIIKK